jgi:hypothetical protein
VTGGGEKANSAIDLLYLVNESVRGKARGLPVR